MSTIERQGTPSTEVVEPNVTTILSLISDVDFIDRHAARYGIPDMFVPGTDSPTANARTADLFSRSLMTRGYRGQDIQQADTLIDGFFRNYFTDGQEMPSEEIPEQDENLQITTLFRDPLFAERHRMEHGNFDVPGSTPIEASSTDRKLISFIDRQFIVDGYTPAVIKGANDAIGSFIRGIQSRNVKVLPDAHHWINLPAPARVHRRT